MCLSEIIPSLKETGFSVDALVCPSYTVANVDSAFTDPRVKIEIGINTCVDDLYQLSDQRQEKKNASLAQESQKRVEKDNIKNKKS